MGVLRRLAVGTCICLTAGIALAATEAEKQAAIDKGLEYLASTQVKSGPPSSQLGWWNYGDDNYDQAATGAAALAFLEQGYKAGEDVVINGTNYGDVVGRAVDYMMTRARVVAAPHQPAGNPDGDGNGVAVHFGSSSRQMYVSGLVVPALARTGTPNALVTTGPLATMSGGTGPGGAWTHKDVVQNATDWFAYGQVDGGSGRGGWRYYPNYSSSDNSTAQWPPVAMLFGKSMGVEAPQFVKDELKIWVDYIQHPTLGGSGYSYPYELVNEAKTGGLLVQMDFAEEDLGGNPYNDTHPDLLAALRYLNGNWQRNASGHWNGNFNHPYAMWSIYKGLEVTVGLDDTTHITNLRNQAALRSGAGAPLDPGDDWTWWEDYCEWLVQNQRSDGRWLGYGSWTNALATAWHINILDATSIEQPVVPLPPASIAGFGLLAGIALVRLLRRRRG